MALVEWLDPAVYGIRIEADEEVDRGPDSIVYRGESEPGSIALKLYSHTTSLSMVQAYERLTNKASDMFDGTEILGYRWYVNRINEIWRVMTDDGERICAVSPFIFGEHIYKVSFLKDEYISWASKTRLLSSKLNDALGTTSVWVIPSNAKFFQDGICITDLCTSLSRIN